MLRQKLIKLGTIITVIGIIWLVIINIYSSFYLKSLNLDYKHQDYIYKLCYKEFNYPTCLAETNKDLDKLLIRHQKNNKKILPNTIDAKKPIKSFFSYYAMSENNILEEYIMVKMLLKKNVLRKTGELEEMEKFKQEMNDYINNSTYYTKKTRTLKLLNKREY